MNYWLAGPTNLNDCFDPFAQWVDTLRVTRVAAAKKQKARGWSVTPCISLDGMCTWQKADACAAWLMQNEYDHYRFTGDKDFLRTLAYPAMKGVCEFWEDLLIPGPDGALIAPMGQSPEHGLGEGVSFSQELVWELFTNTIEASEILNVDPDFRKELQDKLAHLFVPRIGRFGQLQEWMEDKDKEGETYRHMAHLVGLYPGREVNMVFSPKLAEAARVTLASRGKIVGTGWHSAWKAALWARLRDGEQAHAAFVDLFTPCHATKMANSGGGIYGNLFAACPPFQIDANFGFTAAVSEMLLQSQLDTIELLPALPACWKNGKVRGMVARGAIEVDLEWKEGKVTHFTLYSADPKPVQVRVNGQIEMITPEKP
jgi:alpha-L-fucosidase 2